jgi:hypothetical protein
MGNLKTGEHEITVILDGIGPDERPYKNAANLMIDKGTDIKSLEVTIRDESSNYQPSVEIIEWD